MKKIILVIALVVSTYCVNAQAINLHGSVINSTLSVKESGNSQKGIKSLISWKAGVGFDWKLASMIHFMPEVNFLSKGAKLEATETGYSVKGRTDLLYMEVPLNFVYNSSSKAGGIFVGAGPSLGIGFSGKEKSTFTLGGVTQPEKSYNVKFDGKKDANDNDIHYKAFELGANFLAGFRVTEKFVIQANYNLGLSNISPETNESIKSSYIGLGFAFVLTQ